MPSILRASLQCGLALTALLTACGQSAKVETTAQAQPPPKAPQSSPLFQPIPSGREADDAARFLAGLPSKPGSSFTELEKTKAWQVHRTTLDQYWGHFSTKSVPLMSAFQKAYLDTPEITQAALFYPFSGPDTLAASLFFPKNFNWVFAGLEPPGTLPTAAMFSEKDLAEDLGAIRESVYSELHRSFFITKEMDKHFRGQVSDGLLAPILHLLVRTNHTITGCTFIRIGDAGDIIARDVHDKAAAKLPNRGVAISFRSDADQSPHNLFYFSLNLADERLAKNKGWAAFLPKLKGMSTFFKATSYMPHNDTFSIIRAQTLDNSYAILQDDSGLPYRFYDQAVWNVTLFGSYTEPYGSFRYRRQQDLQDAYKTKGPKPLAFKIGYGFSRIPSNLLFATRDRARAKN
jgi:hypothetical protein